MPVSGTSSFQKKSKARVVSIPGTKPSIHNAQLLISTGVPSLDFLLGGGLPLGSLLLIEEDAFDVYSKTFMKLYISEGLTKGHFVHLASLNENPSEIYHDLPAPCESLTQSLNPAQPKDELKIAWRYQDQKSNSEDSESTSSFDVSKTFEIDQFCHQISSWNFSGTFDYSMMTNSPYWSLLTSIQEKIKEHDLLPSPSKVKSNVLRIAVHSFLSPLWGPEFSQSELSEEWKHATRFLLLLKGIVRSSFSVAFITVPSHLISDPALLSRLFGIVDFGLKLESFQGSEKEANPLFADYHGLFHIKKLPAINTLTPAQLDSSDWAFSLKRKKLCIKKLHLPPELSETASRSQEDSFSSTSCSSGGLPKHLLEF